MLDITMLSVPRKLLLSVRLCAKWFRWIMSLIPETSQLVRNCQDPKFAYELQRLWKGQVNSKQEVDLRWDPGLFRHHMFLSSSVMKLKIIQYIMSRLVAVRERQSLRSLSLITYQDKFWGDQELTCNILNRIKSQWK